MRNSTKTVAIVAGVAAISVLAWQGMAQQAEKPVAPKAGYAATLTNAADEAVGTVEITAAPKGILMNVSIDKMEPGWHAIHFHGVGDCADHGDHFKKSGPHASREGEAHGYFSEAGPHQGDFPNFYVHSDGTAKFQHFSANVKGDDLLDDNGTAVLIHAKPDDYISQPAGDAGDRLACGRIEAVK